MSLLKDKLETVQAAVAKAAEKSGRTAKDITLVAVTKGVEVARILEAKVLGLAKFGENRVQEAQEKIPQIPDVEWHMIGHLQTNKIKEALSLFSVIQSVDSLRLAREIDREAQVQGKTISMLLEVNISGEKQKFGFGTEDIYTSIDEIAKLPSVKVLGLMGMAPHSPDTQIRRIAFKKLKGIFSVCKSLKHSNVQMQVLSMGMSGDFETAIEEGANMVRIGRALFG